MPSNKCPHCGKTPTTLKVDHVTLNADIFGTTGSWLGMSFGCQHCHAILGVQVNPLTIRDEIVSSIMKALGQQ